MDGGDLCAFKEGLREEEVQEVGASVRIDGLRLMECH